jgi:hypothetical protein
MSSIVWLAAPYLSVLGFFAWPRTARFIAPHTAVTLPVGWAAVLALAAALVGLWSPPLPVLAVCAALSGLAMLTPGRGNDGPDRGRDEDDGEPPPIDWDVFDDVRHRWDAASRRARRPRARM